MSAPSRRLWIVWGVSAVALGSYFGLELGGEDRGVFLPGETTAGHYQIEAACDACHVEAFADRDAMQAACEGCHLEALDEARDSHPKSKFTDPRNADRTALLDARYCVTCHVEHRPERIHAMGLTVPENYCVLCHEDIALERPTHADIAFTTCASSGCHNFHDNRAIYEDFLLRHAEAPALSSRRQLPARNFAEIAGYLEAYPKDRYPLVPLTVADADGAVADASPAVAATARSASAEPGGIAGPSGIAEPSAALDAAVLGDWADTAHAANGVNCTACHEGDGVWSDRPGYAACAGCHVNERAGFVAGRHGMRLDRERLGTALAPMRPALARLPMRPEPIADVVDCGSCHAPHRFDTDFAAVEACLGCHDDEHSRAYLGSPHHRLVERARTNDLPAEAGVSCATCHLPRTNESYDWGAYVHVLVVHNQSDNLTPNDKMIRTVCLECHGLGFAIDSLADLDLIRTNFATSPTVHVPSIDLALERRRALEAERQREDESRRGAGQAVGQSVTQQSHQSQ